MHAPNSKKHSIIERSLSNLRFAGLCYGYGGLDAGIQSVLPGAKTVLLSEWELSAVSLLLQRMEVGELAPAPIWTDLRSLPWSELVGQVDAIAGGFPCQPFSHAGRREGDQDPRHLFPHIKRGIELLRPRLVVLENVRGIISAQLQSSEWSDPAGTSVALHVARELERCGYRVALKSATAQGIGLPHKRQRVFFVGVRDDIVSYAACIRRHGVDGDRHDRINGNGKSSAQIQANEADIWGEIGGCSAIHQSIAPPCSIQSIGEYPRVFDPANASKIIAPVGGSVNGGSPVVGFTADSLRNCRVWETAIRLCGNGVVPACAAQAVRAGLTEIFMLD